MDLEELARELSDTRLIIISGLPGVGKTSLSKKLAEKLGASHLFTDKIRRELFPVRTYSQEESGATHAELLRRGERLLREGKRVILDATFLNTRGREKAYLLAKRLEVPFKVIYVTASEKTVKERLKNLRGEGTLSEADFSVYKKMKGWLREGKRYSLPTENVGVETIVFKND